MKKLAFGMWFVISGVSFANPITGKIEKSGQLLTAAGACAEELKEGLRLGDRAGTVSFIGDRPGIQYTVPFLKGGSPNSEPIVAAQLVIYVKHTGETRCELRK